MSSSNPLDRDNDVAIGLTLPLRKGPGGYFERSYQTIDQVKSNIINLLKTRRGERVMQPELGSGLWELVFEQNTDELEIAIREEITETLAFWLPYIQVVEFIIDRDIPNIDSYTVEIQLTFSINNDPDRLETVTFTLEA